MKSVLTANDVLGDIEFELVQGAISRDELGQSIQAVRQYQNKLRSEVLASARRMDDYREVIGRLFQVNDMLITLLQEVSAALQSLRLDLRKVARMSQIASSQTAVISPSAGEGDAVTIPPTAWEAREDDTSAAVGIPALEGEMAGSAWQPATEVEDAMRSDALRIGLDVRTTGLPIIGRVVERLRIALHNLALFYVLRLADRQVAVNRTYGDWILRLNQTCQDQSERIDSLVAQVATLQARLAKVENVPPSTEHPATDL